MACALHSMLVKITAAAAIAGLTLALAAPATADGWDTPVVISDGTLDSLYPRVATRSGPGNYVHVVWRDLAGTKVMYRRSLDGGRSWKPIQTLHTGPVGQIPHIATAGNTVHVVWQGSDSAITWLRSTSNGGVWDAPIVLSTPATTGYDPDVAAHQDHVVVAWITDSPTDVAITRSVDNGAVWEIVTLVTTDGNATSESGVRAAVWGDNGYLAWVAGPNVVFRRRTGFIWGFPMTLWTGDSSHVAIAAWESNVFVDRNDPSGPVQRVSSDAGVTFAAAVALGTGDEKPEISASRAYAARGATAYLDTRDSVHRIFVSTGPGDETQIDTITGSSRTVDVGAMKSGGIHTVASSSAEREVTYQRYVAPSGFRWWWRPPLGVARSDAQWGDFDDDGDLDLVISGETVPDTTIVTQTYENVGGLLTLRQSLEGVTNESSGNLAWGDYDNDGDLDLFVGGMTSSGRSARLYENNGLGTLTWDTSQTFTPISQAAAAWGDADNDGDLDLVVTGQADDGPTAVLYRNDPPGTLTAEDGLTPLRGGSVDWGDFDGDADLDLLLTGFDGTNRRIIFYENDPPGTLTDTGAKGLDGVTLSDAAFGDFDADGDLDLLCTGDSGGGSRIFVICENDGAGNYTQIAAPMMIYRSSGAWADYDADGDLDFALCGYDGAGLYTHLYRNDGGSFVLAFTMPGVRDGSVSWADVDGDARLDFFVTGWDWTTTYADLYEQIGGEANTMPTAPAVLTGDTVYRGMELDWSGATDVDTPAVALSYALRVGTTPGGHEIVSGTYATPLMGNVGQMHPIVLDVPADTYYWSVRAVDSGLLASAWAPEQTYQHCPADLDGDGQIAFADLLAVLSTWGPCSQCMSDLDRDGTVGFGDLLIVLAGWGSCP